ncbi:MAG: leuS [Parcubacteria group bacterium]|nr:leuS [Parcubacteria group bacterium]
MNSYDPKEIEPKWQKVWEEQGIHHAKEDVKKPKYYALMEFPYPSGDGLHTGHVRGYTAMDIIARKRRMEGYNVLYPIGWDAFGLPAENYAIKTGIQPAITTKKNIENYRKQFKSLGMSLDWDREVDTTDPKYYKWTQWLFLKFLENDLAYKAKMNINWCPKDKIGLANEEVVDGKCERCGTQVEKRVKEQWMLRITKYADRLDRDLDLVDFPERVKAQQRNWIGRSEGAEIDFLLDFTYDKKANANRGPNGEKAAIKVFTTRPDTIFGATYLVLAPEHPWVTLAIEQHEVLENKKEVIAYINSVKNKEEIERTAEGKEKTGVELKGVKAINPATGEEIPIWIADYVLPNYGTGAIMAVPAHDERDFEFAAKFKLPIKQVVAPVFYDKTNPVKPDAENTIRHGVIIIIKHWSEDKYLLDYSPKFNWKCLFTGGIEEGEDPLEAATREVREETGYQNIKSAVYVPFEHIDKFHAPHKNLNRHVFQKNIFIQLADGEEKERSDEEKDLHHISWLSEAEMKKEISLPNHLEVFEIFLQNGKAITGEGSLINSGTLDGLIGIEAKDKAIELVNGTKKTSFKLRDWIFSRQRYWGEPIPVIHCEKCGMVPVPEKNLPVTLPEVAMYEPTDNGESPLSAIDSWVNVECSTCGGKAKRETDTMPNWAGSSWYFLRYTDPNNDAEFASKERLNHWTPVDWYNGGMEHTTLHLLYSRFWHKFFFDIGLVPTTEPYQKRTSHGLILAEGGVKMSKSKGNVVNPDKVVEQFGADTLRVYEMFMGPFEQAIAWNEESLVGPRRFIEKVWKLQYKIEDKDPDVDRQIDMHRTIKKVSGDIELLGFNTAISTLMIWVNTLEKYDSVSKMEFETLTKLLAPFAPHVADEVWYSIGHGHILATETWPDFDEQKLEKREAILAVQVNGKVRATLTTSADDTEDDVKTRALELPEVQKWLNGAVPKKVIVVLGKIVNIVV